MYRRWGLYESRWKFVDKFSVISVISPLRNKGWWRSQSLCFKRSSLTVRLPTAKWTLSNFWGSNFRIRCCILNCTWRDPYRPMKFSFCWLRRSFSHKGTGTLNCVCWLPIGSMGRIRCVGVRHGPEEITFLQLLYQVKAFVSPHWTMNPWSFKCWSV